MAIHPATLDEADLLAACQLRTTRRSGPGGQHRNKVETAVVIAHQPTGLLAEANEKRSQEANRRAALFRLRLNLAVQVRVPPEDSPSALWRQRATGGTLAVNPSHVDFPALLAEALDHLAAGEFDLARAAEALTVSRSQLTKFLKRHPAAFRLLNDQRADRGQHPVK